MRETRRQLYTCQNTGNMFLLYRSEDIVGEIVFLRSSN